MKIVVKECTREEYEQFINNFENYCPFESIDSIKCYAYHECKECLHAHIEYELTPRWRAEQDEDYWYVDDYGNACDRCEENVYKDCERYNVGNYYSTHEQAEAAAVRVRKAYGEG